MGKQANGKRQLLLEHESLQKLRHANFLYHCAHNGT
jgi:hypothetical protein